MNRFIAKFPSYFKYSEIRNEIRWMMESILAKRIPNLSSHTRIDLSSHQLDQTFASLTMKERTILNKWIHQRTMHHKPLQYILKSVDFCDLELRTRPPTLIPRWETEEWTFNLIREIIHEKENILNPLRVLDLCTGSGCIALALAHHMHLNKIPCHIQGIDISLNAILLAKVNQRRLGIPESILEFHQKDILSDMNGFLDVDLIVTNPPYISDREMRQLDPSVSLWEDHRALYALDNGLYFLKRIIDYSTRMKRLIHSKIPQLVAEIGEDTTHVNGLKEYLKTVYGYSYEIRYDLAQKPRVLVLTRTL